MLCHHCQQPFEPASKIHIYCSRPCKWNAKTARDKTLGRTKKKSKPRLNNQCANCQTACSSKYCSRKCYALTQTGKTKPTICAGCGIEIAPKWVAKKYCRDCVCSSNNRNWVNWDKVTLGDLRKKLSTPQLHSRIRAHSRSVYRRANPNYTIQCAKCPYNKFTEIVHLKSVADYDDSTPISTVNHIDNLAQLCRNCHWELDH